MADISIIQATSDRDIATARELFREYEHWLGLDLCFQGFEQELADLPGKYSMPDGRLLLATIDGETAGCVAMRRFTADSAEMKRLFVRESARGNGVGKRLLDVIITAAADEHYAAIYLDTFPPKMGTAVELYRRAGFVETNAYYDNPFDDVLFMRLDL